MSAARAEAFDIDPELSLGEGDTPLVELGEKTRSALAGARVWCKSEHHNPTGSYKDRVAARAVTVARRRGLGGIIGTSSGNGAAAVAAYGARAGLPVTILTVPGAPPSKLLTAAATGARLLAVEGLGFTPAETDRVFDRVLEIAAARRLFPFITAWSYAPEAMVGAAGISLELADELSTATAVYVPVGGGGLLSSIWDGYRQTSGTAPRIVAVQPVGSATLERARQGDLTPVSRVTTSVSGLQVARLLDPNRAVGAVEESGGHVVQVSDEDVFVAQAHLMKHEGIVVEPAGAVALAGALADAASGRLSSIDNVVVLATGAGWKDPGSLERVAPAPDQSAPVRPDDLDEAIARILGA